MPAIGKQMQSSNNLNAPLLLLEENAQEIKMPSGTI